MGNAAEYKVIVSEIAAKMLVSHARFLAQVSETAALRLISEFEEKTKSLKHMPERCQYLDVPILAEQKYRKLFFEKHYLLLFQIKAQTVYIDAVVDCRQNNCWLLTK